MTGMSIRTIGAWSTAALLITVIWCYAAKHPVQHNQRIQIDIHFFDSYI